MGTMANMSIPHKAATRVWSDDASDENPVVQLGCAWTPPNAWADWVDWSAKTDAGFHLRTPLQTLAPSSVLGLGLPGTMPERGAPVMRQADSYIGQFGLPTHCRWARRVNKAVMA